MGPIKQNPMRERAAEDQAAVTLVDFFDLVGRFLGVFAVGLIVIVIGTFIFVKMFMTPFYLAESTFYVSNQFTSISRVGLADLQIFEANRSDKYLLQQILQAEQWLRSRELVTEAAGRLMHPEKPGEKPINVYQMLKIDDPDEGTREALLAGRMQDGLMRVTEMQNSGVLRVGVELPDPAAAARFTNACVAILQDRFTEDGFRYLDQSVALYEEDLKNQLAERERLAKVDRGLGPYDMNPPIAEQRSGIKQQLDEQGELLGTLITNIEHLRMATDPRAKAAAQPVQVVEHAYPPLRKNRPKTTLTVLAAAMIYSFLFMLGLVLTGLARAARRTHAARGAAPR